ncbi:hypothetical protein PWT90_00566 [Aphanocladium album]|nr:hypothetical protein PWT90_00566 [Aphanocladium album]
MRELDPANYTVAWIAPLYIEARAAWLLFDNHHDGNFSVSRGDDYLFQAGDICGHNVILATLPAGQEYGNSSAAALASQVKKFFPNLWFGLLVGVAAGLPNLKGKPAVDIRLGDVLVGLPQGDNAGIIAYELGKETAEDGFQLLHHGHILATTEAIVRSAIGSIQLHSPNEAASFLPYYEQIQNEEHQHGSFVDPGQENDMYYELSDNGAQSLLPRDRRPSSKRTRVWYGSIGSGDKLMKNALKRNDLRDKYNIIGLEMEAAGTMNRIPVGVIRGVCDYGDQHKNKEWQPYAAAMAAAYSKAILAKISPKNIPFRENHPNQNDMLDVPVCRKRPSEEDTSERATSVGSKRSRLERSDSETSRDQSDDIQAGALNEEQEKALLDSLMFEQIDSRYETIKREHRKTCQWLLKTNQYLTWLDTAKSDDHHGVLWIFGNPGAGKSTLMKFLFKSVTNSRSKKTTSRGVISFFFNARGDALEKSTNGMYRSLLLQLLEEVPSLRNIFNCLGISVRNGLIPDWNVELLQKLFEQAILSLGKSTLMCFIDALDECDQEQISEMILFFQVVSELAASVGVTFQVCFSSRFYPSIRKPKGIVELDLGKQDGHAQDIISYVHGNLDIEGAHNADKIRNKVIEKASGIFMWVVLVVGILQQEHDRGQDHTLEQRLEEIPKKLDDLFRDILMRDDRDRDRLLLCVQWMLFARRPLKPQELHQAILCGVDPTAESWGHVQLYNDKTSEKYILDSSKGLADITKSTKSQSVQFIHESVREFFLKSQFEKIWPSLGSNFPGDSHERLKQCCLACFELGLADSNILLMPFTISEEGLKGHRQLMARKLTFLEFAVRNILFHADAAEEHGVNQMDFLTNLNLEHWIKLDNLFEIHAVRRHSSSASLLYILAEHDAANLIKICPARRSAFALEDQRYGLPILAAVATDSRKAVSQLLKLEANAEPQTPSLQDICDKYDLRKGKRSARRDFSYGKRRSFIINLIRAGDVSVVAFAIASVQHITEIKAEGHGKAIGLHYAAKGGYVDILQLLLKHGATVDARNSSGEAPLHLVSFSGQIEAAKLLLSHGATVNALNGNCETPLHVALKSRQTEVARLLLSHGAAISTLDISGETPLHLASFSGQTEVARLLLSHGATVDARNSSGETPLYIASKSNQAELVQLLLDNVFQRYETSPFWRLDNLAALKLHRDEGARIDSVDDLRQTAINYACKLDSVDVLQLLVEKAANIEPEDGIESSPLYCAAES